MALPYRKDETSAPKVIAKGKEYVAENFRRFDREYGISLVEDKSLARLLKVPVEFGYEYQSFIRNMGNVN